MKVTSLKQKFHRSRYVIKNYGLTGLLRALHSKYRKGYVDYSLFQKSTKKASKSLSNQKTNHSTKLVLSDELVILAGVPYDDIGGGQRGAQLTRAALKTGRKVIYIYVYKKFDFEKDQPTSSYINISNLTHYHVDEVSPKDILHNLSIKATILIEHPHPKLLPFVRQAKIRGILTVFDLIDNWETSLGGDWFSLSVYNEFISTADKVVGSAKILVDKLKQKGRTDALYIPNAANEYIFDKYKNYEKPPDFPNAEKTAIYFGSLYGEWFGWDYITAAAEMNPDMAIMLIGDISKKPVMPANVYFLGSKKIDELPAYLFHSDVALLPFIPGAISDAVSPIKIFEYIFLQKPVVATNLPEIVNYAGVFIADTVIEFGKKCKFAIDYKINYSDNDIFISNNSWFKRLDEIITNKIKHKISVIILIHNNENIIRRLLKSFIVHGQKHIKEIIVIDNASNDNGANIVKNEFPEIKLVRNDKNGCSLARNIGASIATGEIFAFFDSDQWLTSSSCFAEAISLLENDTSLGAVSWGAGWFNSANDLIGPIVDYLPERGLSAETLETGYRTDIAYLATSGIFIPSGVFKATNGFDTFYDPTCFEDTDLSFQIKALGFTLGYRDLSGIRHQPHQTTLANQSNEKYKSLFIRNQNYFLQKWRDFPQFFMRLTN